MNEFERRWKQAANAARAERPSAPEAAPFGFASRVAERWRSRPEPSLAILWQALAMRVLGSMTVALLILLACGEVSGRTETFSRPELESVVADSLPLP